jgi:hypothetical protein
LIGATRGKLGAIGYQGGYHVIHGGHIQGPFVDVVIVGVGYLGGFLLTPTNAVLALAFSELEGSSWPSLACPG